ncbi:MAG: hypothetical protein ACREX6_02330 [Casimicrobiaceae bacterium]
MSIYGGRKSWKDFSDLSHRVPDRERSAEVDEVQVDHGADWASIRRAQPADFILPVTQAWLTTLPADVLPTALIARYPRVVNMIAAQWWDRRECPSLFNELLGDHRGGRAGFPRASQRDLLSLQEYWYNGHASDQ